MNTDKARKLLRKVQALFDNLSEQSSVSALERDLLLSYLRELYEEIASTEEPIAKLRDVFEDAGSPEESGIQVTKKETAPPMVQHEVIPPKPEPEISVEPETVSKTYEPYTPEPVSRNHVPEPQQEQPVKDKPGDVDSALAALFEFKGTGELAEKLTLQPVDRIEHGMGINERILTLNELFNGDSELYKQTLEHLNTLGSFSEAKDYLTSGVASKFKWADASKKGKAAFFIQLVRRRYVGIQ